VTDEYLARIGYSGPHDATPEVLRELHVRHLITVPFENLDIHWQRPIVLDLERILHKIVRERRGGFCYELNGAFAWLLRQLGFDVTMLSARVDMNGTLSPPYEHMALLVRTGGRRFLADVGFGDSFLTPLELDPYDPYDPYDLYVVRDGAVLKNGKVQYAFDETPRALEDFAPRCEYQQTSPESHFTQRRVITRPTEWGRITLTNDRLIVTRDGVKSETPVTADQWSDVLKREFGFAL
jgi:N-hydroxyarylamine O-acetyltransferase